MQRYVNASVLLLAAFIAHEASRCGSFSFALLGFGRYFLFFFHLPIAASTSSSSSAALLSVARQINWQSGFARSRFTF
jgi:hypothetical protein